MPSAGEVPDGYGHMYSVRVVNLRAWVAVTPNPPDWSAERAEALAAVLPQR